jgi:hypothetical protein
MCRRAAGKPAPENSAYRFLRMLEGARRKRPPLISLVTVGLKLSYQYC